MHKDIFFLPDVKPSTRQKVLNFVKDWYSKDEWITVKTSGSTGKPKIIKLNKSNIRASALATANYFKFQPNQSILLALSTDHIAGKMMIVRALESKMKIIVAPLQSNPLLIELPYIIQFSAFVPMQVQNILADPISKANYEKIEKIIIGGGIINSKLEGAIQKLKNQNYATFGMTETISHIALRNINAKENHYTALPNVTLSIDNRNCLKIKVPNICNNTIQTNDIIQLLNNKQFIWKGRFDFVINSGSIKIHPEELEKKIAPLIPQNRFYIIGQTDDYLGEKVILNIESNTPLNLNLLKKNLKQNLEPYEVPKKIIFTPAFKETETGKLIRK